MRPLQNATQAVFGEGAPDAAVLFVGEQPGDQEDIAGQAVRRPGRAAARRGARGRRHRPRRRPTSPTRSSTSSGRRAASGGSTRSRTGGGRRLPARGSRPSSTAVKPASSSASARPRRSRCSAAFRVTQQRGELLESRLAARGRDDPPLGDPAPGRGVRDTELAALVDDLRVVERAADLAARAARRSA